MQLNTYIKYRVCSGEIPWHFPISPRISKITRRLWGWPPLDWQATPAADTSLRGRWVHVFLCTGNQNSKYANLITQHCNNISTIKKIPQKRRTSFKEKKYPKNPTTPQCFHLHEVAEDSLPAAPEVPIALDKALEVRLGGTKEKSQLETLATEVESEKVGLIWIG